MGALTGAQLKDVSDSIAFQKTKLDTTVGDTTTATTILYAMQQNIDRIGGYAEAVIKALHSTFAKMKDLMSAFKLNLDHAAIRVLDSHIRDEEGMGISDYWEQENYPTSRIAPEFAQIARSIGIYLKAAICFPPVTAMGSVAVTGSGTGTFTDGSAIDGNLYGPANCELEVTAAAGGPGTVSLVATVIGTDEDGNPVTGSATFSSASVGDKVDVTPDQAGKKFQDITDITFTGGANGDAFKIQSKVDRAVAA